MNIGNITSDNFNLDGNGKDIQIEFYEQLIEQLQQENEQLKEELKYTVPIVEHNKIVSKKLKENQKYKEVIDKVRNIAYEYGQIDGAHHKTWVIDQMIRELLGTEYDNFIKEYEEDGEYTWDIGIAP